MPCIWHAGKWIDGPEMRISAGDRGWTHGLGLFETMLAVDGRAVFLERHVNRLQASCLEFGWEVDFPAFGEVISELLSRNDLGSGRAKVRLAVSGGEGNMAEPEVARLGQVWLTAASVQGSADSIRVGISKWRRNANSPLSGHKATSYAENLFYLREARENGWDEVLLFNHRGELCEAATANVFLQIGNELVTPPLSSGCLPGIARECLMQAGEHSGLRISERAIHLPDLREAIGGFLSSSVRGPVPIRQLAGRELKESRRVLLACETWERLVDLQQA